MYKLIVQEETGEEGIITEKKFSERQGVEPYLIQKEWLTPKVLESVQRWFSSQYGEEFKPQLTFYRYINDNIRDKILEEPKYRIFFKRYLDEIRTFFDEEDIPYEINSISELKDPNRPEEGGPITIIVDIGYDNPEEYIEISQSVMERLDELDRSLIEEFGEGIKKVLDSSMLVFQKKG